MNSQKQKWLYVVGHFIGLAMLCGFLPQVQGQQPIKIGLSVAQTGGTAGGGKSALLALQIWRDDVNAKGGLLGRKVELVVYDDQGNPALTPGIYAKLLDIDKVDLLIGPYATIAGAPVVPLAKQRGKLLMGNFGTQLNRAVHHDMYFNNIPWNDPAVPFENFFQLANSVGAKTVAFLSVDQEFGQLVVNAAKEHARKYGMQTVYEQKYPANTVDFSSMMRAIQAAKPDALFLSTYPNDGVAIVRAINEMGMASSVKLAGGCMVGLQYANNMESLGPMLNGLINYHFYVPEKTVDFPGVREFLARYEQLAPNAGADRLGYFLGPFTYAIGQALAEAITATKSLDDKVLANYLHTHEIQTVAGPVRYGQDGEWAAPRTLFIQYRGITGHDVDQFRQPGKQVILAPSQYKTGDLVWPFEKAHAQ